MDQETFMPKRKPAHEDVDLSTLPPVLATAIRKNAEKTEPKNKVALTGNAKLDNLLEGIKDTVYKYEEVLLPSRGIFYDGEIAPSDGILHVRIMTGEEEQTLATQRLVKSGQAMNMIYANCVRESINPDKMLAIDRTFLLIYLRGISHGNIYTTDVRCTECQSRFETEIDLDDLELNRCPDDFSGESLQGTLPKSGYKFAYRFATGKDEQLIQDYKEKKNKKNEGSDDTWAFRFALLLEQIEGLEDKAAIQVLLTRLPVADVSYIRSLINEPPFGVDTNVEMMCPHCNEEFEVLLPMDVNFFFPSQKKGRNTQA